MTTNKNDSPLYVLEKEVILKGRRIPNQELSIKYIDKKIAMKRFQNEIMNILENIESNQAKYERVGIYLKEYTESGGNKIVNFFIRF